MCCVSTRLNDTSRSSNASAAQPSRQHEQARMQRELGDLQQRGLDMRLSSVEKLMGDLRDRVVSLREQGAQMVRPPATGCAEVAEDDQAHRSLGDELEELWERMNESEYKACGFEETFSGNLVKASKRMHFLALDCRRIDDGVKEFVDAFNRWADELQGRLEVLASGAAARFEHVERRMEIPARSPPRPMRCLRCFSLGAGQKNDKAANTEKSRAPLQRKRRPAQARSRLRNVSDASECLEDQTCGPSPATMLLGLSDAGPPQAELNAQTMLTVPPFALVLVETVRMSTATVLPASVSAQDEPQSVVVPHRRAQDQFAAQHGGAEDRGGLEQQLDDQQHGGQVDRDAEGDRAAEDGGRRAGDAAGEPATPPSAEAAKTAMRKKVIAEAAGPTSVPEHSSQANARPRSSTSRSSSSSEARSSGASFRPQRAARRVREGGPDIARRHRQAGAQDHWETSPGPASRCLARVRIGGAGSRRARRRHRSLSARGRGREACTARASGALTYRVKFTQVIDDCRWTADELVTLFKGDIVDNGPTIFVGRSSLPRQDVVSMVDEAIHPAFRVYLDQQTFTVRLPRRPRKVAFPPLGRRARRRAQPQLTPAPPPRVMSRSALPASRVAAGALRIAEASVLERCTRRDEPRRRGAPDAAAVHYMAGSRAVELSPAAPLARGGQATASAGTEPHLPRDAPEEAREAGHRRIVCGSRYLDRAGASGVTECEGCDSPSGSRGLSGTAGVAAQRASHPTLALHRVVDVTGRSVRDRIRQDSSWRIS